MLKKPKIQNAISASEKGFRQLAREQGIGRRKILLELKKVIGSKNAREKLAGINTLCKLMGDFSPRKEEIQIEFTTKPDVDYSKLTSKAITELQNKILSEL